MKVQKIRIQSFCKLKMLRHAQIQSVKTAKCFRKRQSHFLQTQTVHKCSCQQNVFSKKWGWAQRAHASAKRLPPFFGKKTFYWKELLCTVWICKKWDWRFLKHLAVLTFCICACLSICSLQKNWIRIFCTFIPIPKEWIRAFFARAFFWKKLHPCFWSFFKLVKNPIHVFSAFLSSQKMTFMFL